MRMRRHWSRVLLPLLLMAVALADETSPSATVFVRGLETTTQDDQGGQEGTGHWGVTEPAPAAFASTMVQTSPPPLAFVNKQQKQKHAPPEGFTITARVYTDNGHAVLERHELLLPYQAWGSTTFPFEVHNVRFRQAIGSIPIQDELLLVALTDFELQLAGVEEEPKTHRFDAGSVVWFQDDEYRGHKCKPVNDEELSVMLVTLNPRDVGVRKARRWVLGGVGMALMMAMSVSLSKVVQIWTTVAMGGSCLVAGGTYAFVQTAESVCDAIENRRRRRRPKRKTNNHNANKASFFKTL